MAENKMRIIYDINKVIDETPHRKFFTFKYGFYVVFLDKNFEISAIKKYCGKYIMLRDVLSFLHHRFYEYDLIGIRYYLEDMMKWERLGLLIYKGTWKILTSEGSHNFLPKEKCGGFRVEYHRYYSIFDKVDQLKTYHQETEPTGLIEVTEPMESLEILRGKKKKHYFVGGLNE